MGPGPAALSWRAQLVRALAGVAMALVVAELALRAGGFRFDFVPSLEFGWPDPKTISDVYQADPDLLWVTRDYQATLAAARREPPAIVFMGDSCTEFGSYPARTLDVLRAEGSPLRTGVKVGVGGWSSEQGLLQLRRDIVPLHPRVVTIYYGWNDHWVAHGLTDPEITGARRFLRRLGTSRIIQAWLRLRMNMAARRPDRPNRVPLPRYEENLRQLAAEARRAGIIPVFITAPANHLAGHEPAYLAQRHLRQLDDLVPLHQAYVAATRRIAGEAGVLCDAAAAFDSMPHDRFFRADGIHLTEAGDQEMARILSECITSGPRKNESASNVPVELLRLPLDAHVGHGDAVSRAAAKLDDHGARLHRRKSFPHARRALVHVQGDVLDRSCMFIEQREREDQGPAARQVRDVDG
jgi:lysophospholipase L1-like esterase